MKRQGFLRFTFVPIGLLLFMSITIACGMLPAPTQTSQGNKPATQQPSVQQPTVPAQQEPVEAPRDIRSTHANNIEYLNAVPMSQMVKAKKSPVRTTSSGATKVGVITWGADEATIFANGGRTTQPGSIFAREGLSIELFREDNFVRAVEKVISGETPYLRGTKGMVSAALEVLEEQGIEMVEIYNLSRSTGGDTMVCRTDTVKTSADLKGRYVGVQLYGPHMYYLARVVKDAGLSMSDVKIRWLRELTIPPYDTKGVAVDPMTAMQRDPTLACVMVISPDMLALTSGGTVGTGAESSVKGAYMLLSTKDATHVIYDVYMARKDYLDTHRAEVQKFVHSLMVAAEEQIDLFNQRSQRQAEYQSFVRKAALILRDNEQLTADVEGLYADMTFAKYPGNVQFYSGQGTTRTFEALTKETQEALIGYGLLTGYVALDHARWDYALLAQGLRDTAGVQVPKFDRAKVEQHVSKPSVVKQAGFLELVIPFDAGAVDFNTRLFHDYLDGVRITEKAEVYGGAIIVIEGHADCGFYNAMKARGASGQELGQIMTGAKNTSKKRADVAQAAFMEYVKARNVRINESQFVTSGVGCERPIHPSTVTPLKTNPEGSLMYGPDGLPVYDAERDTPEMKQRRAENRRVIFKFIPAVAELEER